MATIDELKKNDGNAVNLGSVRPNPVAKGFAPAPASNSFSDAAASSLDARVSQIPATGGAFPAPAYDGKSSTELGRNVSNTLSALPGAAPALGAISSLARAIPAVGSTVAGFAGAGAGAAALGAKVAPYAIPAAGLGALSAASKSGAQAYSPTPAIPGSPAALAQSATSPDATGMQPPSQVSKTMQPNGVTSYSGTNVVGDINLPGKPGGMISAQNNQAAENLARAGGQTSGFGPSGAIRGGGQVSSLDTSAGYAADLKQLASIDAAKAGQETNMQAQADFAANKVLEGRALTGNRGALQILSNNARSKTEQRGQDIQAGATRANYQMAQDKLKLDTAKDGRDATAAGFAARSAGRIEALQAAYEAAKPEDRTAIAEQLRVMTGKDKPSQWKALALQGATDSMGNKTEGVLAAVNEQTGEVRRLDQGAAQAKAPHTQDIARLKENPKEAAMFEQIYGAGTAKQYIGK